MFKDKLKSLIEKGDNPEGDNKKKIENLAFFVIILIITIVVINIIWSDNKQVTKSENTVSSKQLAMDEDLANPEITGSSDELEIRLQNILTKIQGVGEVQVFVNYSESSEVIPMFNENSKNSTTEETDTSGGIRKIQETDSQKDIIYKEENGEKVPITQKIVRG